MPQVAVAVGLQRLVAPDHDAGRVDPLLVGVAVVVADGGVRNGEVAQRRHRAADPGQVAAEAGEAEGADVRRVEGDLGEPGHLPVDVAPGAVEDVDGVAAVAGPDLAHLGLDDVVGLVPADALPLVGALLPRPLHRVLDALLAVHGLQEVQAADAELAVVVRRQRIALDVLQPAVLGIEQHAAGVMAPRRRIMIGAGDRVAVLLPLPLAGMIGLPVDALAELLVVCHC